MAAEESERELCEIFENASAYVRTVAGRLKSEDLLYLYARFKQAKEGPCNVPRPGFFDFQGKQKWDAWNKLADKTKKEAMLEYVSTLSSIDPDWEEKIETGKVKPKSGMGVAVSTMMNPDEMISDDSKSIFDWCKEGNAAMVTRHLDSLELDVNDLDENGMALIHWACDRGYVDLVSVLLNHGASINIQDCEGQTPLHYAASCEHLDVVRLLLSRGADVTLADSEGTTVIESTDNSDINALLTEAQIQLTMQ